MNYLSPIKGLQLQIGTHEAVTAFTDAVTGTSTTTLVTEAAAAALVTSTLATAATAASDLATAAAAAAVATANTPYTKTLVAGDWAGGVTVSYTYTITNTLHAKGAYKIPMYLVGLSLTMPDFTWSADYMDITITLLPNTAVADLAGVVVVQ